MGRTAWLAKTYQKRRRAQIWAKLEKIVRVVPFMGQTEETQIRLYSSKWNRQNYIARIKWFMQTKKKISSCYIESLYVAQKWRNRGIGTRLLHDAAMHMHQMQRNHRNHRNRNSVSPFWITLDDASSRSGQEDNIYRKCGFQYEEITDIPASNEEPVALHSTPKIVIKKARQQWKLKTKHNSEWKSQTKLFFPPKKTD